MWQQTVTIFEDEDESELLSEFVKLSARWPSRDPITIARQVFRNLKDPELRAGQAAIVWANDLNVLERIHHIKVNGEEEPKTLTKETIQAKIIATAEDETLSPSEKKARLDCYKVYLESEGLIIKAVEKKVEDKRAHFPQVTQAVYAD